MRTLLKLGGVFFLVVAMVSLAMAQGGPTGAITGTVQDTAGAAIAGAKVEIVNEATGAVARRVAADSSGAFTAQLLPVGSYSVVVSAAGFATTKFTAVAVVVTETTRVTAVLKVAQTSQTITVEATVATVNTENATTGQALGADAVTGLPLETRNFQQLLTLSTGASADLNNGMNLGRGIPYIHVNGGREDNNNYEIEGISAADYAFGELTYTPVPNPEALQEFKVSTSLYDASQGRNGGGNIDASLRGGTNSYHFDVWEFFRNTDLDANNFFLNEEGLSRPRDQQNIFGGDFGGPVGKDAFLGYFYVNYQGTRQRSGYSPGTYIDTEIPVLPTVRTEANLISTFFPAGGVVPAPAALDPVAFNLLTAKSNQFGGGGGGWLIPTVPGTPGFNAAGALNYGLLVLSSPGKFTDNQFVIDWDRPFRGGKDQLVWRFFWSDSETYEPFGADNLQVQTGGLPSPADLNFPLDIPLRGRFGSIAETHQFTNFLVNELRFGVNVISDSLVNVNIVTNSEVGIDNPSGTAAIYRFQFGSWQFGPYPTSGQSALSDALVLTDTASWTHGKHTVRIGGEVDHVSIRRNLPVLNNGLLYFAPPQFNTDFQSFLLGAPYFGEVGGGASNHDYRIPSFGLFVQDDFRVTRELTLNIGYREEFIGAPYDKDCHIGNVNPGLAIDGQPFVYPQCVSRYNLPGFAGTLAHSGLDNNYASVWEPRIGLAYDLFGHHDTVIRAGYGIYGVREDLGAVDNLSFTAPIFPVAVPFLPPQDSLGCLLFVSQNCANAALVPPPGVISEAYVPVPSFFQGFAMNAFPYGPTMDTTQTPVFSGNVNTVIGLFVPFHWIAPTTQQWNLTVQRQLFKNWFVELGYVGTKGTHLRVTYDPDGATLVGCPGCPASVTLTAPNGTPYVITQNTASNAPARAPFQPLAPSAFEAFSPISDSHYNALQLTVSHHFSKGLYFQSAYTFSKSIDDVSTASVAFLTRFNNQDIAADSRGLSDFDRRNRWVTSFVYELPFYKDRHDWVGTTLGGWSISGVLLIQSGEPFSIMDSGGGSAVALASPAITADFAPGFSCSNALNHGSLAVRLDNWVNPAAYMPAPVVGPDGSTGYGDSPRNCVIGPGQGNLDFTLNKNFKIAEHQNLRFRVDFFNLTNHPSFANPSLVDIESPETVGKITSTVGNPRLVQFSLKYSY